MEGRPGTCWFGEGGCPYALIAEEPRILALYQFCLTAIYESEETVPGTEHQERPPKRKVWTTTQEAIRWAVWLHEDKIRTPAHRRRAVALISQAIGVMNEARGHIARKAPDQRHVDRLQERAKAKALEFKRRRAERGLPPLPEPESADG